MESYWSLQRKVEFYSIYTFTKLLIISRIKYIKSKIDFLLRYPLLTYTKNAYFEFILIKITSSFLDEEVWSVLFIKTTQETNRYLI